MTHISWFKELTLADRPEVGGKGASLGELGRAGVDVPPGFVVRTEGFRAFLEHLETEAPLRDVIAALDPNDLAGVERACSEAMERVRAAPLPEALRAGILEAHGALEGAPVAIRSSATSEDADDASFAGLQDTFLYVMAGEEALERIRDCWASLYSVNSVIYRRKRDLPEEDVAMAVVVQKMVDSEVSGVMFTRSPLTGDKSVMMIEGAFGLGSAVVGGEVTPDRFVLGKITGSVIEREIAQKTVEHRQKAEGGVEEIALPEDRQTEVTLDDERIEALRQLGRRIEKHYGKAQDIEWAIERGSGTLFVLQSRGETVWSQRDAEKAAVAANATADPKQHVLRIFGGKT